MADNEKIITEEKPKINWFTLFVGAILGFALACLLYFFYRLGFMAGKAELAEKKPLDDLKPMKDITPPSTSEIAPAISETKSLVIPTPVSAPEPLKAAIPKYHHTEDFKTVIWEGKKLELSTNESRIVEKLWKAFENHVPEIHQSKLLEDLSICSKRVRDVFKSDIEVFKTLFAIGERKGTLRLKFNWE